jgi:probable phosphoglycerate mutase
VPTWTFVRHGESVANAEGWLAGQIDSPLTPRGLAQAEAGRAATRPLPLRRAVASDLSRAYQTAEILLRDHPGLVLQRTPALRERECGQWRRRRIDQLDPKRQIDALLRGWETRPPDGESLHEVAYRAIAWLASIEHEPLDTLVVAHGALIRSVVGALDGTPTDRIGQWSPGNCEVVPRSLPVGGWADLLARIGPA